MYHNSDSPETHCRGTINGLLRTLERLDEIETTGNRKQMIEVFFRRRIVREKLLKIVNLYLNSDSPVLLEAAEIAKRYLEIDTNGWVSPLPFDLQQLHHDLQLSEALLPPENAFLRNRVKEYFEQTDDEDGEN